MARIEVTPCVWGVVGHSVSPGEHLPDRCQLHPQGIQHTTCWRWYCTQVTNADTDPEASEEPRPPGERQGENLRDRHVEKRETETEICWDVCICPFFVLKCVKMFVAQGVYLFFTVSPSHPQCLVPIQRWNMSLLLWSFDPRAVNTVAGWNL